MIEAVMFWNEPNNKSHWDFEVDPGWTKFSAMVKLAADAVRSENPRLQRVLGGISPIDPGFIRNMDSQGVLSAMDVVALHGFHSIGITGRYTNGQTRSRKSAT